MINIEDNGPGIPENEKEYIFNNPGLSPSLGKWIRENRPNLKIIGFDFISLTSFQNRKLGAESHKVFLGNQYSSEPIRIIEDMNLEQIEASPKRLIVSPLLVANSDGTPVTVFALNE